MSSFRARSRFATLVAVGLALLVSGVVAGAAGGNFILGQANSAGTSNTSLTTSSTGNALLVTNEGGQIFELSIDDFTAVGSNR